MTKQLVDVLKGHRNWMKQEVLRRRWGTLPDWVFCNEHGGSLSYPNSIHRVWNRALEKSDLRRRTPHDMRHTYATLRLSKGDSLAEVSKEMGHASTDITYRTYYKWLPKESRSNIDELDDIDASTCNPSATKN
jgi:integrase